MSSANILSTRTPDYLELVGNGKTYRVPAYQRDYSWTEEQWEDLWNDVKDLLDQPSARHYMGAVVVQATGDRSFLIIDGQQRMATLSILALAVIQRLQSTIEPDGVEANRERASELRSRFIGEKDPASLLESSKLSLNDTDDAFYQDYLVQLRAPTNARGLRKSNRLMWDAFRYFGAKLAELPDAEDGVALTQLLSETVARQLLFILITVDDELNAYTVFETLNARGLELTTTDLLKNYLFSLVHVPSDLDALQRRWRALIATVTQERFPEFLRYHLLVEQPMVRSQRLFKIVRDRVKTPPDVFDLLDALESRSELFAALSDVTHDYWVDLPAAQPYIRELNLFRVRQTTPLLFVAWEKFTPEDFVRTLKLVSVISFRYTVIGALNTNLLEPVYHQAAKAVDSGAAVGPSAVFERLATIYVEDRKFLEDFAQASVDTGGQRRRLAKYILGRIEERVSGRPLDHDTDPATIEHILPENPDDDWDPDFPRAAWEAAAYRLGNLTLLEATLNRALGNAPYETKRYSYAGSRYQMTRDVPLMAPEHWTVSLLNKRQTDMANHAVSIWRSDFA